MPAHARTHSPAILSTQETKSWDVPNLELLGYVCYGSKSGFTTLLVPKQFCTIRRSWKFDERCTAILFGSTEVTAVYAPDSRNSLEMYETCISSVVKVLREGRRRGAKDFNITGDLNVELGLMCTDEKDIEELTTMYGPLCWQGYDKDPGGFKQMWYGIMKEFNCKATSTWSVCGIKRENTFTHRHSSPGEKGDILKLGYIIGPVARDDEICIHIEERSWATWDHYPIYARVQEDGHSKK